ncbi:hypothetical protein XSR1_1510003 [Xenorhabdus szentirmaii DSM 16338]|uniref:Transposase n=1 Tax=Xenorhabdus szentirmaii DSM 16338 TaxID=1427518 RepID=W1IV93_9GAMM|nr:hypothetical protein XSR1_1510003 [Xenorhabdus szentirmaii DSM 16338]
MDVIGQTSHHGLKKRHIGHKSEKNRRGGLIMETAMVWFQRGLSAVWQKATR